MECVAGCRSRSYLCSMILQFDWLLRTSSALANGMISNFGSHCTYYLYQSFIEAYRTVAFKHQVLGRKEANVAF